MRVALADINELVSLDQRSEITGALGAWIWKAWKLAPVRPAFVEITWTTGAGRPSLGATDVLVYIVSDVHRSAIAATGRSVEQAERNTWLLGLTLLVSGNRALSEVYWKRTAYPRMAAGAAFHEIAHNKSQQDNGMHAQEGFLAERPLYLKNADPTEANLRFMAQHLPRAVTQIVLSQEALKKFWHKGETTPLR